MAECRLHHIGTHAELEDHCCTWVSGFGKSPDRLDSLVYAITDLAENGHRKRRMVAAGRLA